MLKLLIMINQKINNFILHLGKLRKICKCMTIVELKQGFCALCFVTNKQCSVLANSVVLSEIKESFKSREGRIIELYRIGAKMLVKFRLL